MPRPAKPPLLLEVQEREELIHLARSGTTEQRLAQRVHIILEASQGGTAAQIAKEVGVSDKTVAKWTERYVQRRSSNPEKPLVTRLADATRVGRPDKFDELFWIDVLSLATSKPEDHGLPITHWTVRELSAEVMRQELIDSIHYSTVSRFLVATDLRPHRTRGWMNRKADPEFEARATEVKDLVVDAPSKPSEERVVVSFDEKTGMQAKERIAPDKPMKPGSPAKLEFEYKRHGTLCLFALMVVHTGVILGAMRPNRTNEVTAKVLGLLFEQLLRDGYKRIDIILDQLNTHWSADLVEVVARLCRVPLPAAQQIRKGPQRRAWLSDPKKAIVFHYTPKHASWLNPIECWFGVLARKVLRRGSFLSTTDLEQRVERFIAYYKERLAHPYTFRRWKQRHQPQVKNSETGERRWVA